MAGWRMLGLAVVDPACGALLLLSVRRWCGEEGETLASAWLLWHQRCRAFSRKDLAMCKKSSKARIIWDTLRRGTKFPSVRSYEGQDDLGAGLISKGAARILTSLRAQGFARGEVGRLPFHLKGELPSARLAKGHLRSICWVEEQLGAASESGLAQLLDADGCWYSGFRSPYSGWTGLGMGLLAIGEVKLSTNRQLDVVLAARGDRVELSRRIAVWRRGRAPTLISSRGLDVLRVSQTQADVVRVETLNAQDWATMMGIPVTEEHAIRRGLRAVSDSAGKSIMGQAVHFGVAVCLVRSLWSHICGEEGLRPEGLRYVSLMSGIDVMAAAVDIVSGGRWRFVLAAEANAKVACALKAAWGAKLCTVVANALGRAAVRALATISGRVDLLMISLRCAPWSAANTLPLSSVRRQEQLERALEENQALLAMATATFPRVIVLECVAGMLRPCMRPQWSRLQGMIVSHKGWSWSRQMICPKSSLKGWMPRRRVWIVGIRRATSPMQV